MAELGRAALRAYFCSDLGGTLVEAFTLTEAAGVGHF
jgi:hypothetical protein